MTGQAERRQQGETDGPMEDELEHAFDRLGSELLGGLAFSLGFLALLLGRSELFTEGFLVPVTTVVARHATVPQLARSWSRTLAANLVGGWVIMCW